MGYRWYRRDGSFVDNVLCYKLLFWRSVNDQRFYVKSLKKTSVMNVTRKRIPMWRYVLYLLVVVGMLVGLTFLISSGETR